MPIYDYHCTACGADSEILHKISDPPETVCPECGKPKLVKQVSAAGFRLSGGGWYETDFKSSGKKNLAGEQGADKPAAAKADDSGSAAKKTETAAPAADKKPAAATTKSGESST